MAPLPIELVPANTKVSARLLRAIDMGNNIQQEFRFGLCDERSLLDVSSFAPLNKLETKPFLDSLERARDASRGYHPFLIAFTEAFLVGPTLSNLFGHGRVEKGIAISTFYEVDSIMGGDDDGLTGYALYYLGRYGMGFASPSIKVHRELRQCIYDRKDSKQEIIDSMRSGGICDSCRAAIWASGKGSTSQMDSVARLIEHASSLVHKTAITRKPNVFIASSSKNLAYARALKSLLEGEFRVQVWDEDQVFRLGTATIEQLEQHINYYDFGIFLMLPDDKIVRDDKEGMVPRDNVVFEAGLFTGKLGRDRALILAAHDHQVLLPTDLNGLTTMQIKYDDALPNGVGEAATRASKHIKHVFGQGQ